MELQWSLHRCTVRRISTRLTSVSFIDIPSVQLCWICWNPFLEMLLGRALVLLLFYTDIALPETIEIVRFMKQNNLRNWKKSIDTFTLPESVCNQTKSQYVICGSKFCKLVELSGSRHYRCSCSNPSPTLTYDNSQWICQKKGQVRSQFGKLLTHMVNSRNVISPLGENRNTSYSFALANMQISRFLLRQERVNQTRGFL